MAGFRVGPLTMRVRTPLLLLFLLAALVALPAGAGAAVTCPNSNPVVNENNCMGAGSTAWQLTNYDQSGIVGYATKSSVNLGESVTLRIANQDGEGNAEVSVFRMGWYGGAGGRLVYQNKKVVIANERRCEAPDETTGYWSCGNWENSLTVPGSSLPASGVYLARIKDLANGSGQPGHLHRPQRRPPLGAPLQAADRHLPGLQLLQRPLAVSLQLGRLHHGHRHLARGQGLLRPALRQQLQRRQLVPQSRLPAGLLARARGLRSRLHRQRLGRLQPGPAAQTQNAGDLGPRRVLVGTRDGGLQGGPRRRRQHRLVQRQHRLLEGSATRTTAARWSVTRRSRGPKKAASPTAPKASTTGAPTVSKAPKTTPSASTAKPGPATTTRSTRPPPGATTALPPAIPTPRAAAASGRTNRRTRCSARCTSATTTTTTTR